jgi:hypothetical protein
MMPRVRKERRTTFADCTKASFQLQTQKRSRHIETRCSDSAEVFQRRIPIDGDCFPAFWICAFVPLGFEFAVVDFWDWLGCREGGADTIRRLHFEDFLAIGAFEDTFGVSHNASSTR